MGELTAVIYYVIDDQTFYDDTHPKAWLLEGITVWLYVHGYFRINLLLVMKKPSLLQDGGASTPYPGGAKDM